MDLKSTYVFFRILHAGSITSWCYGEISVDISAEPQMMVEKPFLVITIHKPFIKIVSILSAFMNGLSIMIIS